MRIVDLSHDIYDGMPTFPLDPETGVLVHHTIASMKYNVTRLTMGTHLGTHIDAPHHFFDDGRTVDSIELSKCIGPAHRINLQEKGARANVTVDDLRIHENLFTPGSRVIMNFGWYRLFPSDEFYSDMPGVTIDCAEWIASKQIGLLGLDVPGVHAVYWEEVHKILLREEIVLVEALNNLDELTCSEFFFAALPMKIRGRDGSPVRAIGIEGLCG